MKAFYLFNFYLESWRNIYVINYWYRQNKHHWDLLDIYVNQYQNLLIFIKIFWVFFSGMMLPVTWLDETTKYNVIPRKWINTFLIIFYVIGFIRAKRMYRFSSFLVQYLSSICCWLLLSLLVTYIFPQFTTNTIFNFIVGTQINYVDQSFSSSMVIFIK